MAQTAVLVLTASQLCQASDNATAGTGHEGWVSQPNGRGTSKDIENSPLGSSLTIVEVLSIFYGDFQISDSLAGC